MAQPRIPPIKWSENDNYLQWKLVTELEKEDNRKVYFGKKLKTDNTSGDSKAKVNRRIAQALFPDRTHELSTLAERVKSHLEKMIKTYQTYRKELRVTGGGLQSEEESCYVPSSGPDESTPMHARNLWDEICGKWPFFPRFHQLLGTRPNSSPIMISTGVSPAGLETQWMQPCRSAQQAQTASLAAAPIPPLAAPVTSSTLSVTDSTHITPSTAPPTPRSFATNISNVISNTPLAPCTQSLPTLRTTVAATVQHAKGQVPKRPRNATEAVIELVEQNMLALRKKAQDDQLLASRKQLFDEFKAGLWTRKEWRQRVKRLEAKTKQEEDSGDEEESQPSKKVRHESPDWESDLGLESEVEVADD